MNLIDVGQWAEKWLNRVRDWAGRSWSWFIWLSLRGIGFNYSITDVRHRCDTTREKGELADFAADNPPDEELLALSKDLYDREERRREGVDDKIKSLLTLSALLLPLSVAFLPKVRWMGVDLFPVVFLFLTVALLIEYLGVGRRMTPALSEELAALPKNKRRSNIIRSYMASTTYDQNHTDFLVDIYRAARVMFILSLISAMLVVLLSELFNVAAPTDGVLTSRPA